MDENLYVILDVDKDASSDDIKKAYRKMAFKWHPDKNKEENASEMFKKISNAYNILSDPEKKKAYDQFGMAGLNNIGSNFNGEGMGFDPFNMFKSAFGGDTRGGFGFSDMFQHGENMRQNNIIEIVEQIQIKDIFTGKKICKQFNRKSICNACKGTGSIDGVERKCKTCNGRKMVQQQTQHGHMISIHTIQCMTCNGTGNNNGINACKKCGGEQVINEMFKVDITIPIGCSDNEIFMFNDIGNIDKETKKRDKVIVKINIAQDEKFMRNVVINERKIGDSDLLFQMPITFAESLCGCSKKIEHITGKILIFNVQNIIKNNDMYTIEKEGLPQKNGGVGNLHIIFNVEYILNLTIEKKKILWNLLTEKIYNEQQFEQSNSKIVKFNEKHQHQQQHRQSQPQPQQCAQQ